MSSQLRGGARAPTSPFPLLPLRTGVLFPGTVITLPRFDLEDFLNQLQQVKQMGPINQLLEMIPGLGAAARKQDVQVSDDDLKQIEAIIRSMTAEERRNPQLVKGSRRKRIAVEITRRVSRLSTTGMKPTSSRAINFASRAAFIFAKSSPAW